MPSIAYCEWHPRGNWNAILEGKGGGRGQKRKGCDAARGQSRNGKGRSGEWKEGNGTGWKGKLCDCKSNQRLLSRRDARDERCKMRLLSRFWHVFPDPVEALCHYGLRYRHNITITLPWRLCCFCVSRPVAHFPSSLLNDTDINYSRSCKALPDALSTAILLQFGIDLCSMKMSGYYFRTTE